MALLFLPLAMPATLPAASDPAPVLPFGEEVVSDETLPIVLSASRLRQPLAESPAAITIIDRELIELSGARTVVDLLSLVPGFQVGRRLVGNPVATYLGLSERYNPHLQLLIDGRPTYVPLFGGVPWHELPIAVADIERIEVTRAPNAATFGPNSFSTVVSIATREPAADAGWRGSLEGGGNRFASGTLSYHGSTERTDYRLGIGATTTEGHAGVPDTARSRMATFRLITRPDARDRWTIDVGALRGGHVELDPIEIPEQFAPYEETTNLYAQLVWERVLSVDDAWRVQYYHNRYDIEEAGRYAFDLGEIVGDESLAGTRFAVDLDRGSESSRHELEVQRRRRLAEGHRVVLGGAVRHDGTVSRYVFDDDAAHTVDTGRLFAHSEYELRPEILVQTGLLAEHSSLSGTALAPRASVIGRLSPGQRLRFGYSRGLRTPLPIEEEGTVVFDYELEDGTTLRDFFVFDDGRSLEPETNDVFDIGYHLRANGRLTLDAKLAHQRMRGIISTRTSAFEPDTFDGAARPFENRFDYRFSSLDLQLDSRPSPAVRLRASYSHAFGMDRKLDARRLVPRHTLALFGAVRVAPTTTLSGELYYVGDWIWDDARDVSRIERLDLRLARVFRRGVHEAELAVQAELELGENTDYLERNEVEDRYFVKLSLRFP